MAFGFTGSSRTHLMSGGVVKMRNAYCTSSWKWCERWLWCTGQRPGRQWGPIYKRATLEVTLKTQMFKDTRIKKEKQHKVHLTFSACVSRQQHTEPHGVWTEVFSEWDWFTLNHETLFWCNYANITPLICMIYGAPSQFVTGWEQRFQGFRALLTFIVVM